MYYNHLRRAHIHREWGGQSGSGTERERENISYGDKWTQQIDKKNANKGDRDRYRAREKMTNINLPINSMMIIKIITNFCRTNLVYLEWAFGGFLSEVHMNVRALLAYRTQTTVLFYLHKLKIRCVIHFQCTTTINVNVYFNLIDKIIQHTYCIQRISFANQHCCILVEFA